MATVSQLTANRENSRLSTGPVTDAGKAASSQNARTHGLSSGHCILPGENADDYQSLVDRITTEMQPSTEHEGFLVGLMAQARWKLGRIENVEDELLTKTLAGEPVATQLALILRYSSAAERSYYKAHTEFMRSRRQQNKDDQAELNQAIENYIMAPPGQAQAVSIKVRQPLAAIPQHSPQSELASSRKSEKPTAAAALGNLALRL